MVAPLFKRISTTSIRPSRAARNSAVHPFYQNPLHPLRSSKNKSKKQTLNVSTSKYKKVNTIRLLLSDTNKNFSVKKKTYHLVACFYIGSVFQEDLHHLDVAFSSSQKKCGVDILASETQQEMKETILVSYTFEWYDSSN